MKRKFRALRETKFARVVQRKKGRRGKRLQVTGKKPESAKFSGHKTGAQASRLHDWLHKYSVFSDNWQPALAFQLLLNRMPLGSKLILLLCALRCNNSLQENSGAELEKIVRR
jgi:hypothetical protein